MKASTRRGGEREAVALDAVKTPLPLSKQCWIKSGGVLISILRVRRQILPIPQMRLTAETGVRHDSRQSKGNPTKLQAIFVIGRDYWPESSL
jgi:hypothetical protein